MIEVLKHVQMLDWLIPLRLLKLQVMPTHLRGIPNRTGIAQVESSKNLPKLLYDFCLRVAILVTNHNCDAPSKRSKGK